MKEIFKRYLVFVIGLYFLAAGIVLIIRSALGTTPISSINYVLSLNSPLSLGTCTFIINMLLILGQFWLIRKNRTRQDIIEIFLQLPFSFIFSAFIDFNMMLTSELHPANYGMSIALLLTGCMVQSIGVVLELKPKVAHDDLKAEHQEEGGEGEKWNIKLHAVAEKPGDFFQCLQAVQLLSGEERPGGRALVPASRRANTIRPFPESE